ncbi:MAG TPA: hypothetical protein VG106_00055 [Vicinamibacterales bacterium]|nr:hypothetical protein [Vicinamibacterales bacterium]
MGTRFWAAWGNVLRLTAVASFFVGGLVAIRTVDELQRGAPSDRVAIAAAGAALFLALAWLFWAAKPAMVSGRPWFARWLGGGYLVVSVISSTGLVLIFLLIAYVVTRSPEVDEGPWSRPPPAAPPKLPRDWRPTGRIGLSGATLYSDAARTASIGLLDAGTEVQVLGERDGFGYVVAASGHQGWIDLRTYTGPS